MWGLRGWGCPALGGRAQAGHAVASVGQPGQAQRGGEQLCPCASGSLSPAGRLSPWHALRAPCRVCLLSCLSLSSLATELCDLGFGLAIALFSRRTLGLWKEHQTWSPGAVFGSISAADSLDPGHVSASLASVSPSVIWQDEWFSKCFSAVEEFLQMISRVRAQNIKRISAELGQGASSSGLTATQHPPLWSLPAGQCTQEGHWV